MEGGERECAECVWGSLRRAESVNNGRCGLGLRVSAALRGWLSEVL